MDKGSKKIRFPVEAGIFFFLLGVLGSFWLGVGPSNQELLANYAKAKDLADLIWAKKGFAWWSPNYLGGSPTAIQCGSALVHIWLLTGAAIFGPIVGGKIVGFVFLGFAGLLMATFLQRLTGDRRAAWVGAFFYAQWAKLLGRLWPLKCQMKIRAPRIDCSAWCRTCTTWLGDAKHRFGGSRFH